MSQSIKLRWIGTEGMQNSRLQWGWKWSHTGHSSPPTKQILSISWLRRKLWTTKHRRSHRYGIQYAKLQSHTCQSEIQFHSNLQTWDQAHQYQHPWPDLRGGSWLNTSDPTYNRGKAQIINSFTDPQEPLKPQKKSSKGGIEKELTRCSV